MRTSRTLVILLSIALLGGIAWAQAQPEAEAAPVPVMPQAESVMKHIPAGAMGFVVVNNIKDGAAKVESFLTDIGVADMIGLQAMPGGLVGMLQAQAQLSEDFNPDGGFAAVMLDPQQFGVDLMELMNMGPASQPQTTAPADQQKKKVPFVLLIPGKGVKEVFSNYCVEEADPFYSVSLRMGPMFAVKCGDYVAISPTAEALKAMLETEKKVSCELTQSQQAAIAKSQIAMHVNMKITGPIYSKILEKMTDQAAAMQEMGNGSSRPAELLSAIMPFYRDMIAQLDAVTVTGRFAETGLVFSEQISWDPQSQWGKALASYKPSGDKLLGRLPNLPYILAYGESAANVPEEFKKMAFDLTNRLLGADALLSVSEETKTKIRDIIKTSYDQMTGFQLVVGGAPEGAGVFGLACVMKCRDTESVKTMLAQSADVVESLIKTLVDEDDKDIDQLKITYTKDAETAGELAVDAIDILHPELEFDEDSESDRQEMQKILGESRLRLRAVAVDKQTAVITFGGAGAFLAEAIKAAQNGGTIMESEAIAEAMQYMPKNRMSLMLLSGGNLFDVITKGMKTIDPEATLPPFEITTKVPIAVGSGIAGTEMEVVFYLPSSLIKDVVGGILPMLMGRPGGPAQCPPPEPAEDDEDF